MNKGVKIGRKLYFNKTGHDVLYKYENQEILFPGSKDECWRLKVDSVEDKTADLRTFNSESEAEKPLPEPQINIIYIVSKRFKQNYKDRKDFQVPREIVRDENNNVLYCQALDS